MQHAWSSQAILNPGPALLSPPGPCGSCKHAQWGAGSVPPSNVVLSHLHSALPPGKPSARQHSLTRVPSHQHGGRGWEGGWGTGQQQEAGPTAPTPQTNSLREWLSSEQGESGSVDMGVHLPWAGSWLQWPQLLAAHMGSRLHGASARGMGRWTQPSPGYRIRAQEVPNRTA